MADKTGHPANVDGMEESLSRLSKKPGVKGWIMLDRTTGAILRTSGKISQIRPAKSTSSGNNNNNNSSSLPTPTGGSFSNDVTTETDNETLAAQELGSMIWSFLSSSGSLVQEMDTEDELKLLRLRTKKQELVIVPEAKYIMVVVHDTPRA